MLLSCPLEYRDAPALSRLFTRDIQQSGLKMQQHENYNPSSTVGLKMLMYYKLVSFQICDLSSGTFLCMLLHNHDTCGTV